MLNHYFKVHKNDKNAVLNKAAKSKLKSIENKANRSESGPSTIAQLSITKRNQLEVSRYTHVDALELKFTFDYLNKSIGRSYKRLNYLTQFYLGAQPRFNHFIINTNSVSSDAVDEFDLNLGDGMDLRFDLSNQGGEHLLRLKPFEIYSFQNANKTRDSFILANVASQIVSMDWCPTNVANQNQSQFVAIAACPLMRIDRLFNQTTSPPPTVNEKEFLNNHVHKVFEAANLIYVCKLNNLNVYPAQQVELFALLHRTIGHINCVKWRPDCGASISKQFDREVESSGDGFDETFIGYLLSASSDGNAYVDCVQDMSKFSLYKHAHRTDSGLTSIGKLNVFEGKRRIVLRPSQSYGQCMCGDWSQLKGATEIALGKLFYVFSVIVL